MTRSAPKFLAFIICLAFASLLHGAEQWSGVDRIVAIGDVHGDMDGFVATLRNAGLINRRNNWTGGATHLVQVGDIPDRGPDTREIVELMKKLQRQAENDGGMVHALIGNHEAMNMLGDLRYVHPGEYEAFRGRNSRQLRDNLYEVHLKELRESVPILRLESDHREQFNERYPLGYIEHRFAWAADGEIGSWVTQHNAVIRINRILFLHGGIGPEILGIPIAEINDRIRAELSGEMGEEPGLSEMETGPLWYRGLAQNDAATEAAHVDAVLEYYDVDHIVIGHTPGLATVVPRFGGKVILIDSGMSAYYGSHRASLEITNGEFITHQGEVELPLPISNDPLLPYLETVAEMEDGVPALQRLIEQLRQAAP